jgi:hypothetical protein
MEKTGRMLTRLLLLAAIILGQEDGSAACEGSVLDGQSVLCAHERNDVVHPVFKLTVCMITMRVHGVRDMAYLSSGPVARGELDSLGGHDFQVKLGVGGEKVREARVCKMLRTLGRRSTSYRDASRRTARLSRTR